MSENTNAIEIPSWVVNKIGTLELENEVLRQENAALRQYIESLANPEENKEEDVDG